MSGAFLIADSLTEKNCEKINTFRYQSPKLISNFFHIWILYSLSPHHVNGLRSNNGQVTYDPIATYIYHIEKGHPENLCQ